MILVDTSVVLDALSDDPVWGSWSKAHLQTAAEQGGIAINSIVYAELSVGFRDLDSLEAVLAEWSLQIQPIPRLGLFWAGKAYQRYRSRSGIKTGVLPDFFIGAHAAVEGWKLLTRDTRRVGAYFPAVALIAP